MEDEQLGKINLVKHKINTEHAYPILQAARRMPLAKQSGVENHVNKMTLEGIIEESSSPWSDPVVLVTKKDGSIILC